MLFGGWLIKCRFLRPNPKKKIVSQDEETKQIVILTSSFFNYTILAANEAFIRLLFMKMEINSISAFKVHSLPFFSGESAQLKLKSRIVPFL